MSDAEDVEAAVAEAHRREWGFVLAATGRSGYVIGGSSILGILGRSTRGVGSSEVVGCMPGRA